MSGTFNDIDVPPTLVSFAVDVAKEEDIITPEFKHTDSDLFVVKLPLKNYDIPDYTHVMKVYETLHRLMQKKMICSAYVLDCYGIVPALSKMGFGNKIGVTLDKEMPSKYLFANQLGGFVLEVPKGKTEAVESGFANAGVSDFLIRIGRTNDESAFVYDNLRVEMEEALASWTKTLEKVFPTKSHEDTSLVNTGLYEEKNLYVCKHKVAKPKVFIPVFPGTNCEYDSAKAFSLAGAEPIVKVFKNQNASDIRDSVEVFADAIRQSQMIMFPGGFSAGDEPEGSAKFFATAFRNEKMKEAVNELLTKRDGLCLGICNGFQALIKLGLVPFGEIQTQTAESPTLTYNTIGRHISKMAHTKVVSNKSPWLLKAELGGIYDVPASHGEGRFVANEAWLKELFANGQVATQYVDEQGCPTMDEEWNINGSFMAIEGITSKDGRVFGKMCHSERIGDHVAINIYGKQDMHIFASGVEYFK